MSVTAEIKIGDTSSFLNSFIFCFTLYFNYVLYYSEVINVKCTNSSNNLRRVLFMSIT
jgi:hypothetical protein